MEKNNSDQLQLNDKIEGKDKTLFLYTKAIPRLLVYQFIAKNILGLLVAMLKYLIHILIDSMPIHEISNMDIPYLFKSWQGLIAIVLVLFILCIYVVIDINMMILICDDVLHQRKQSFLTILKRSIVSFKNLWHPKAILVLLYVSIIAPLTVSFFGISLTESFYIPDFITSVIHKSLLFQIPYYVFLGLMGICGILYLFSFHFMILRKVNIKEALYLSRETVKKYLWDFIKRYGLFLLKSVGVILLGYALFCGLPLFALSNYTGAYAHFWMVFVYYHCKFIQTIMTYLFTPFQIMELSRIYESYTLEDEGVYRYPKRMNYKRFIALALVTYYGSVSIICLGAQIDSSIFNMFFPEKIVSNVVAHRAGGTMANENSLPGLEAAIEAGVYGSEIDVQRTKDGYYIINHDDTFERLCGVDKTPMEMTLKEIKQLEIPDTNNILNPSCEVATLEEMLDTAKGNIHMFVELKGKSADSQMAEDVYQMIKERDMLDSVTVISLKYNLIDELETNHPEVSTGYLCFMSLGKITSLNCDIFLLEDEMASSNVIEEIHEEGKEVYIWTVNSEDAIKKRLMDGSDGIITDDVEQTARLYKQLNKDDNASKVFDRLILGY